MTKRFVNLAFPPDLLKAIEEFRFQAKFSTRADAIRWLLEFALKQKPKRT